MFNTIFRESFFKYTFLAGIQYLFITILGENGIDGPLKREILTVQVDVCRIIKSEWRELCFVRV